MNHLDALDLATEAFGRHLAHVTADQWTQATPCDEWDVRFLVAHVVGGNRFASLVLNGESASTAIDQIMTTPQLGERPAIDFAVTSEQQSRDFRVARRLEAMIDHPAGSMTASRFLSLRVSDITLHGWDLAHAIGGDTTIDDALVETVLDIVDSEAGGIGFGSTALGLVGPGSTAQERLLDLNGRR